MEVEWSCGWLESELGAREHTKGRAESAARLSRSCRSDWPLCLWCLLLTVLALVWCRCRVI